MIIAGGPGTGNLAIFEPKRAHGAFGAGSERGA